MNASPPLMIVALSLASTACQAVSGLASLDVEAGGAETTTSGDTTATTSATGGAPTSATTTVGAGGAGGATTTTGADGGAGGGATTTTGAGGGTTAGTGGHGGAGGATGSTTSGTGGGDVCTNDAGCDDVCLQYCDGPTCEPGVCAACGAPPSGEPVGACPPFCANDCAGDVCAFSCGPDEPPCSPTGTDVSLKTSSADMELHCTAADDCIGRTVHPSDPQSPPNTDPDRGPYDVRVVCESAGVCDDLVVDCTGHNGECVLDCAQGACAGVTVKCGFNRCVVHGCADGNTVSVTGRAGACSVDALGCD